MMICFFEDLPTPSRIATLLEDWAKAAGITYKKASRHTFGIILITLGVDIYAISELMGHANIETTKIYAKIVSKKKDDAGNLVDSVF